MLSVWPALEGAAWPRTLQRSLLAKRGCGGCLRQREICPEPGEFWHCAGPEGWAAEFSQAGRASSCCQQGNSAQRAEVQPRQTQICSGQATLCCIICKLNGSETTLNSSSLCCRLPGAYSDTVYQYLEHCHCKETLSYFAIAISSDDFMTNFLIFTVFLLFSWSPAT